MTINALEHNAFRMKALVDTKLQQQNKLVLERRARNVLLLTEGGRPEPIRRETFWYVHIGCLLTSQQKSSYNDPVPRFLREKPFPLSYMSCLKAYRAGRLAEFTAEVLQQYPGIRFAVEKIPGAVEANLSLLEKDLGVRWKRLLALGEKLLEQRKQTPRSSHYQIEDDAAIYVDDRLKGFGSKQSRNFWQWLGLTRYVSVIDSRVQQWCEDNLEGDWGAYKISQKKEYTQMANVLRKTCSRAGVLPCMFDAAAFSEGETDPHASLYCRGDKGDWDEQVIQD